MFRTCLKWLIWLLKEQTSTQELLHFASIIKLDGWKISKETKKMNKNGNKPETNTIYTVVMGTLKKWVSLTNISLTYNLPLQEY